MKTFPMFLRMDGRTVVVSGGGEQAAQKVRLMLKTEARIVVAAPALEPELAALAASGRIVHHRGLPEARVLADAALIFAASGCAGADAAVATMARALGRVVNAVDQPELCEAYTPSLVDRDPVVVAIGTEGTAPVLARQIKTGVERMLEPSLGDLAAFAGRMRGAVAEAIPRERRRSFWAWVFSGEPRRLFSRGAEVHGMAAVKRALTGDTEETKGSVSLVGAGPGAADLITLRGIQRLQEADIILYDRLAGEDLLEHARRDAERVCVGKAVGDATLPDRWSQERINRLIVAEALAGKQVVRLKSGDPGIFGRAAEEARACTEAGIQCEIVPGITAAHAAMAEAGGTLTERGEIDSLVLTTGTDRHGALPPGFARHYRPGTQLAVYMGVGQAEALQRTALDAGGGAEQVTIVQSCTGPGQRIVTCNIRDLAATVTGQGIEAPAVILIRIGKDAAVGLPEPVADLAPARASIRAAVM